MIKIDEKLCKGCGICVSICPVNVLVNSDKIAPGGYIPTVKNDRCTKCQLCEVTCPDLAIWINERVC